MIDTNVIDATEIAEEMKEGDGMTKIMINKEELGRKVVAVIERIHDMQQIITNNQVKISFHDTSHTSTNFPSDTGYDYNALAYYQQHQQYFEHLRRTNPQAYAEWYNRLFYAQSQAPSQRDAATTDGRESVHSGRSSVNENRFVLHSF